ncbi:MAG: hypothetical protein WA847_02380 [Terriglobales bacterium]
MPTSRRRTRTPQRQFTSPPRVRALDVVLVCGTGKQSEALCKVQSLFFLKKVSFSHVVLTIRPGVYLHSTTADGVHFAKPSDIWGSPHYKANQLVIRSRNLYKDLSSADIARSEIIAAAIEYAHEAAGTPYNYLFDLPMKVAGAIRSLLKKDKNALFCSELAAQILREHDSWALRPERTWPAHFEHKRGSSWDDVTSLHADYAALYAKGKDPNCVDRGARYCFEKTERAFQMSEDLFSAKLGQIQMVRNFEKIERKYGRGSRSRG